VVKLLADWQRPRSKREDHHISRPRALPAQVAISAKSRHNGGGGEHCHDHHDPRAWTPDSWRACPIRQVPAYPDEAKLTAMEARIGRYSPAGRGGSMRSSLWRRGKALVPQGEVGHFSSAGTAGACDGDGGRAANYHAR
jgi:hypothetical protein